jgi:succinate dehydrogenase/fumarate reductase cytochrome b subunit
VLFLIFFHSLVGLRFFLIRCEKQEKSLNYILTATLSVIFLLFLYLLLR